MKGLVVLTLSGLLLTTLIQSVLSKEYDIHFIRLEKMKEDNDLFEYNLKSVEKVNGSSFKVNVEADLKIDFNEEYFVSVKFHLILRNLTHIFSSVLDKSVVQQGGKRGVS